MQAFRLSYQRFPCATGYSTCVWPQGVSHTCWHIFFMKNLSENSEFDRFTNLVDRVLSVSKSEVIRREAEYEKQAALNPKRRGPKLGSKRKPRAASPDPAACV